MRSGASFFWAFQEGLKDIKWRLSKVGHGEFSIDSCSFNYFADAQPLSHVWTGTVPTRTLRAVSLVAYAGPCIAWV